MLLDALRLGRVGNLPTVWSNVLAGAALAGVATVPWTALLACSLAYTAGMYLNDAFDRERDRLIRPERPIPSGRVAASTVFVAGFLMLLAAIVLLFGGGFVSGALGVLLAAAILVYDLDHAENAAAPVVMGTCRALVYAIGGSLAVGRGVLFGALVLGVYVVGLTFAARREHEGRLERRWPLFLLGLPLLHFAPWWASLLYAGWTAWALRRLSRRVPEGVGMLISGVALVDLLVLAETPWWPIPIICFSLTRVVHRFIPGT